jgi:Ca2+-binding EF-hand superfamily protein
MCLFRRLDIEKTFEALREVTTAKGKLTDEEIEMLLKATAGESKSIDLQKFMNMMSRIKVSKGQQ